MNIGGVIYSNCPLTTAHFHSFWALQLDINDSANYRFWFAPQYYALHCLIASIIHAGGVWRGERICDTKAIAISLSCISASDNHLQTKRDCLIWPIPDLCPLSRT
jgi:hypothetical protein